MSQRNFSLSPRSLSRRVSARLYILTGKVNENAKRRRGSIPFGSNRFLRSRIRKWGKTTVARCGCDLFPQTARARFRRWYLARGSWEKRRKRGETNSLGENTTEKGGAERSSDHTYQNVMIFFSLAWNIYCFVIEVFFAVWRCTRCDIRTPRPKITAANANNPKD